MQYCTCRVVWSRSSCFHPQPRSHVSAAAEGLHDTRLLPWIKWAFSTTTLINTTTWLWSFLHYDAQCLHWWLLLHCLTQSLAVQTIYTEVNSPRSICTKKIKLLEKCSSYVHNNDYNFILSRWSHALKLAMCVVMYLVQLFIVLYTCIYTTSCSYFTLECISSDSVFTLLMCSFGNGRDQFLFVCDIVLTLSVASFSFLEHYLKCE